MNIEVVWSGGALLPENYPSVRSVFETYGEPDRNPPRPLKGRARLLKVVKAVKPEPMVRCAVTGRYHVGKCGLCRFRRRKVRRDAGRTR